MINSKAFNYINVLEKAADASWLRGNLITNNIANVSTPNYKRQDVNFESVLFSALSAAPDLDKAVNQLDVNSLSPQIYTDHSLSSYRLDGNNVDIDQEQANFAENQIKYNALVDAINEEFNRLNRVLTNI